MEQLNKNYPVDISNQIYLKRADNVKIVKDSTTGKIIYICPFPSSHFSDAQEEAKQKTFKKLINLQSEF